MISIENKTRGPLTLILENSKTTAVHPRNDVDPKTGRSTLRRKRVNLGTSLRLQRREIAGGPRDTLKRELPDSIKHETHIKAAALRGEIKIVKLVDLKAS